MTFYFKETIFHKIKRVQRVNEDFLKLKSEHVIVEKKEKKTENRQRRCQKNSTAKQNNYVYVKNVTLDNT